MSRCVSFFSPLRVIASRALTVPQLGARVAKRCLACLCVAGAMIPGTATALLSQPMAHESWLTPDARAAARSGEGEQSITQPKRVGTLGGVSPWVAPLASAILPGAGQGLLRQQRGVVYAAAEGYLVLQAIRSNRDASRERDAYRDIARSVARAAFGSQAPDGDWPYYERMQYTLESGRFNVTPGNGFTPEPDPATFNGSIWQLARETFWRDPETAPATTSPEYQRAIEFYQRRAASDDFRWSWRDAQLEQDVYRQTIVRANEASRRTKQIVGLLLANHALSLVDSYMSVRLRVFGTAGTPGEQRLGVAGSLNWP